MSCSECVLLFFLYEHVVESSNIDANSKLYLSSFLLHNRGLSIFDHVGVFDMAVSSLLVNEFTSCDALEKD